MIWNVIARSIHPQIEATKIALADTYKYVSDIFYEEITVADLLSEDYLKERASLSNMTKQ